MHEAIRVSCLVDRYWDPTSKTYLGETIHGTFISSGQSMEGDFGKLSPTGIVLLDDGTFQSIPLEFIQKEF